MSFKASLLAAMALFAGGTAQAQQYPSRPITMLCWSAAGSPVDVYARVMAKLLTTDSDRTSSSITAPAAPGSSW